MITEQERRIRVITIMNRILEARAAAKRPLESRRLVNSIHHRHPEINVQTIYGTLGYLTRANIIKWAIRQKGGRSYFI